MINQLSGKVSEASGKGIFSFDTFEREASFKIEFYIEKEALVFMDESFLSKFSVKLFNLNKQKQIEASLSGNLYDGSKIHIDRIILISTGGLRKGKSIPIKFKVFSPIVVSNESLKPVKGKTEIRYYITNFELLDYLSVSLDGYTFNIKQIKNYEKIIEQLKKNKISSITAEIIVKADLNDKDKIYLIISNICELLSFATGNYVVPITEEHLSNGKFVWSKTTSMRVDNFRSGDQLIPHLPLEAIMEFVIKTYPNYTKLKNELGLNVVFDYYLLMKSNPVLDVRCLLGFVLLECLSNYAQGLYSKIGKPIENNMKKGMINKLDKILPKSNNLSKKTKDKIIEEFTNQFPSLPDSIQRLMKDFGMRYKKKEADIWKLRKEFVHKGMFPKNTTNHFQHYSNIVHFIDRLLLHILNYDDEFMNIANGYKTEKLVFYLSKR